MRSIRKAVALMLAMVLLAAVFGGSALADSYRVKTMKAGTWYKAQSQSGSSQVVYKLKLTKDMILSFSMKGNTTDNKVYIYVYYDKACTDRLASVTLEDKQIAFKRALGKGTYYFRFLSDADKPAAKVRVSTSTVQDKANYRPSKALSLKSNKAVTVAQLPMNTYDRWYRIKLPTEKSITISVNTDKVLNKYHPGDYIVCFKLLTKDLGHYINYNNKDYDKGVWKTSVLPAGTYYLLISEPLNIGGGDWGNVVTFKWK